MPCSVFLCPVMYRAVFRVLSSLCLLLRFVLISGAKLQRYLQPTKQKTKKVWFINNLQQISMILPKFIQILSTKLAKCAIYKANFFAFAECPHTNTHVHYNIKTNNRLPLQSVCVCVVMWYSVGCKCRLHSKITTTTKLTTFAK